MDAMKYNDLRDFLTLLEQQGELKRITLPVDPHLEITEIADRTLRAGGPALLFENPKGYSMPVLCNLFGTPKRVAMGMGQEDVSALREVGKLLAFLKEPEPPKGFRRVELCQICQRNEVLHHLNIALHFQLTTANQCGKLLAIAKFRQHTGVGDNGAVSIACPFAQYINLAFAEHQNQ